MAEATTQEIDSKPFPVQPAANVYGPWAVGLRLGQRCYTLRFEVDLETAPDIFAAMFDIGIDHLGGNVFEPLAQALFVQKTLTISDAGIPTLKATGAIHVFPLLITPPATLAVRAMGDSKMPPVNVRLKAIAWSDQGYGPAKTF